MKNLVLLWIGQFISQVGDAIFRFLFDPAVSPTNNAAERSIRAAVIDRRITQGPVRRTR